MKIVAEKKLWYTFKQVRCAETDSKKVNLQFKRKQGDTTSAVSWNESAESKVFPKNQQINGKVIIESFFFRMNRRFHQKSSYSSVSFYLRQYPQLYLYD